MRYTKTKDEERYQWVRQVIHRRGVNLATVALANKHARWRFAAPLQQPDICVQS